MKFLLGLVFVISFHSLGSIPLTRVVVQGVKFPVDNLEIGQVSAKVAFPHLSFTLPMFVTHPGDGSDTLYLVEQDGRIRFFKNDPSVVRSEIFLNIQNKVERGGPEQGLLGLAFDPNYRSNGFFYVFYSARSGPRRSVIARFRVNPATQLADPASEKILLEIPLPPAFANHNGGMLAFGPDGYLYIGVGDGGSGNDPQNNAQNLKSLLGKILRIDPAGQEPYSIPSDNPFLHSTEGYLPEIFAYGLRNPWRFSFDIDGKLWAGDVGQNRMEEIDIIKAGANYGWRIFEGTLSNINPGGLNASQFEAPVWSYLQSNGGKSVTGGYVYRGSRLSSLRGAYVYGDFVSGNLWALRLSPSGVTNLPIGRLPQVTSFGLSRDGELFGLSLDGRIYQFEQNLQAPSQNFPTLLSQTGLFQNLETLKPADGIIEYDVNVPLWSDGARKRRWILLPGLEKLTFKASGAWQFPVGTIFIKHFEIESRPGLIRRLETRVMLHERAGWAGYTYRWNSNQTDAHLINNREEEVLQIEQPGGVQNQTWTYPSRSDCMSCHTAASGYILGARTSQLNREFDYDGEVGNQLSVWSQIQFFNQTPASPSAYEKYPRLTDVNSDLKDRARAYLAVNCASCHLPGGPTPTNIDLRFETPTAQTNLLGVNLTHLPPTVSEELRIRAGDKAKSAVWNLMRQRSGKFMPPISTNRVDPLGTDITGRWIDSLAF